MCNEEFPADDAGALPLNTDPASAPGVRAFNALIRTLKPATASVAGEKTEIEFRDVRGFEGYYIVSNTGIVISIYRCWHDGNRLRSIRSRVRVCCKSKGYPRVLLYAPDGRRRQVGVHILVAEAFVPPYRGETVNHKDYDRANNNASNLEWCSRHANTVHGKLRKKNVYLTGAQIDEIRVLGRSVSRSILAERYNVSCPTIDKIVHNRGRSP